VFQKFKFNFAADKKLAKNQAKIKSSTAANGFLRPQVIVTIACFHYRQLFSNLFALVAACRLIFNNDYASNHEHKLIS